MSGDDPLSTDQASGNLASGDRVVAVVGVGGASRPPASAAEVAAVVAALAVVTGGGAGGGAGGRLPRWRFSGRWWSKPLPQRRERP